MDIIANWKMNGSPELLKEWLRVLPHQDKIRIGLAPPSALLALPHKKIWWGAQNMYYEEKGAFTGELATPILESVGVDFVLVGHSERRHVFGENDELIAKKVCQASKSRLDIVLCVGETAEQRKKGEMRKVVRKQLKSIQGISKSRLYIAYEPVWAIGTGDTAAPEQAQEAHAFIRSIVNVPLLYGGSVTEKNAAELVACPDVDGLLVGGASLVPEKFRAIIEACYQLI